MTKHNIEEMALTACTLVSLVESASEVENLCPSCLRTAVLKGLLIQELDTATAREKQTLLLGILELFGDSVVKVLKETDVDTIH